MEYDNPDSSVGLDRSNYPQNTGVVITIDDQAMNVDPTSEDSWYINTDGAPLYGTTANFENAATHARAEIARAEAIPSGRRRTNPSKHRGRRHKR